MGDLALETVAEALPQIAGDENDHMPAEKPTDHSKKQQQILTEELQAEIVRQVEFYFSDDNIVTDDFMLKQVQRTAEGFVPIKVIASFRKMQKLTRRLDFLSQALSTSQQLEVSTDGTAVRRIAPLPDVDLEEVRKRTVIADNLPPKPTIEYIMDLFSKAGTIVMTRIRKENHPEPLLTKGLRGEYSKSHKAYALVEYSSPEEAHSAVALLHEPDNWRTGLRVRPLIPGSASNSSSNRNKKRGSIEQQQQHSIAGGAGQSAVPFTRLVASPKQQQKEQKRDQQQQLEDEEEPVILQKAAQPWQPKRRAIPATIALGNTSNTSLVTPIPSSSSSSSSSHISKALNEMSIEATTAATQGALASLDILDSSRTLEVGTTTASGVISSTSGGGSIGVVRQPAMPDGTRGFSFGRGKSLL